MAKRTLLVLTVTVLILAFAASWWWVQRNVAPPRQRVITVQAKRFVYTPNMITVNQGDEVIINLVSQDVHHGFYLDGYQIETSARPGDTGHVHFIANRRGRYTFRCSVTCGAFHPYMVGYLLVRPDYRMFTSVWLAIGLVGAPIGLAWWRGR